MFNEATIALLIFLLSVAFAAGAYAASQRAARKQINGLGARLNRVQDDSKRRMDRIALALVHLTPADQREAMIRILLVEDADGKQL